MKPWLITPFDYDIYQGLMPPQCPHCKEIMRKLKKVEVSTLHWLNDEKQYSEEKTGEFTYLCLHCGEEVHNIGINGVLVFYRNKGEEAK